MSRLPLERAAKRGSNQFAARWTIFHVAKGAVLAIRVTLIASSLALAGCGSESPVEHTNATTTDRLDEISQNITEFDGTTSTTAPSTPDELGQSMRAGAADRPRPR
jgi:hypothetical protein